MNPTRRRRTIVGVDFALVLVGLAVSSCSSDGHDTPDTTTISTVTTTASPGSTAGPTEKSVNPTGGNLFTPPVRASQPNYTPDPTWWIPK